MLERTRRTAGLTLLVLLALGAPLAAQQRSVLAEVGHLFDGTDRTVYRLGMVGTAREFPAAGAITVLGVTGDTPETLLGLGYELQFGRRLVYFTGGVSAGAATGTGDFGTWASATAGFGLVLPLASRLALQVEGRLRAITGDRDGGQELAAGLRFHLPRPRNPLDPIRR